MQSLLFVPTKGIEPSLPCENQILSLARLPIPPYGLKEVQCYMLKLFLPNTIGNISFLERKNF